MKRKDIIKSILGAGLLTVVLMGSVCFGLFVLQTDYGILLSGLFGFILVCLVVWFCYPVWFKDYINEFWKDESKDLQDN